MAFRTSIGERCRHRAHAIPSGLDDGMTVHIVADLYAYIAQHNHRYRHDVSSRQDVCNIVVAAPDLNS